MAVCPLTALRCCGPRRLARPRMAAVRAGRPALRACRRLGLPSDPDQQKSVDSELASLAALGLDPVTVEGDYRCALGRCSHGPGPISRGRQPVYPRRHADAPASLAVSGMW